MKILFDTSILIAALVASHPKHELALKWLQRASTKNISLIVSSHTLAECYAVLTRLPTSPRIAPSMAFFLIEKNIKKFAKIVALSSDEYFKTLKHLVDLGLTGGIVYDAILLRTAVKAKAEKILTFNVKDFRRLASENPEFILSP